MFKIIHNYLYLGWLQVKLKYTRSLLGPLWITISTIILIAGMSLVNLSLFKVEIAQVMPWIAVGITCWGYISTVIEDSLKIFEDQKLLNIAITPFEVAAINVSKNFITFIHNLFIIIIVVIIFKLPVTLNYFYLIYGCFILIINSFSFTIIFGILCVRFRDFVLIIKNLLFLLFLMTPIFWIPYTLNNNRIILADYNPLFQIIQTIRDPLLGNGLSLLCIIYTFIFTLLFLIIATLVYKKNHKKLVFWI
jgi:lipopolysaccharide transport system permease protein